jgi:hypothetical protein
VRRRTIELGSVAVAVIALGLLLYNATLVDRRPPSVARVALSTTADGNDHLAQTLTTIDLDFTEPVRTASVESRFHITPYVAGTFSWDGQTTAIFTPSHKLTAATTFVVTIDAGYADVAGNIAPQPLDPWTFQTVGPPLVMTSQPADGADNVSVAGTVVLTFDRLMDTGSVEGAIQIQPPTPHHVSWSGKVVTISFDATLAFGTQYALEIGTDAADTDGSRLAQPFQLQFTTVAAGLGVTATLPAVNVSGASVRTPIAIVFDHPIDPATIGNSLRITPTVPGSLRVADLPSDVAPTPSESPSGQGNGQPPPSSGASPPSSVGASPGPSESGSGGAPPATPSGTPSSGRVLLFSPSGPLAAHTTYTVTLEPVVAPAGEPGEVAAGRTWTFTTGQPSTTAQNQIAFLSSRAGVRNVWLMNPDGSNPRQLTAELAPVTAFDVTANGRSIAYAAGGVVRVGSIDGGQVRTLTAQGSLEYSPLFTPDGTSVLLARRDAAGADLGYWLVSVGGGQARQVLGTGAPPLGSSALVGDGLERTSDQPNSSTWAGHGAWSADGRHLLLVAGTGGVQLIDFAADGSVTALQPDLTASSTPSWDDADLSFVLVAHGGGGDGMYRIGLDGAATRLGPGAGSVAVSTTGGIATLEAGAVEHVAFAVRAGGTLEALTSAVDLIDRAPSFSPDGTSVLFMRVTAGATPGSAGIWTVQPDGRELRQLSVDGTDPRWLP